MGEVNLMLLKPIKKFKVAEQNMYFISSFKYISATHCSTLEVKDYDRAVKKMQDLAVTYRTVIGCASQEM